MTLEEIKNEIINNPYGFIYITTNLENGKRYLGQRKFSYRWEDYIGSGSYFKNAIKNKPKENFIRDIICVCFSPDDLNKAEYDYSVLLNVVESDNWYNLVYGGGTSQGWKMPQSTKDIISKKAKERFQNPENHPMYNTHHFIGSNNPMYQHQYTEETINKMKLSQKERFNNPEERNRLSEFYKEYWRTHKHPSIGTHLTDSQKENLSNKAIQRYTDFTKHPMYGRHHTDESKKKMSDSRNGANWWNCRRVYCMEMNEIFWGAKAVKDIYNFDPSGIIKCCRGKRKSYGKYPEKNIPLHWLYVEDAIAQGYITQNHLDDYLNNLKNKGD